MLRIENKIKSFGHSSVEIPYLQLNPNCITFTTSENSLKES